MSLEKHEEKNQDYVYPQWFLEWLLENEYEVHPVESPAIISTQERIDRARLLFAPTITYLLAQLDSAGLILPHKEPVFETAEEMKDEFAAFNVSITFDDKDRQGQIALQLGGALPDDTTQQVVYIHINLYYSGQEKMTLQSIYTVLETDHQQRVDVQATLGKYREFMDQCVALIAQTGAIHLDEGVEVSTF